MTDEGKTIVQTWRAVVQESLKFQCESFPEHFDIVFGSAFIDRANKNLGFESDFQTILKDDEVLP